MKLRNIVGLGLLSAALPVLAQDYEIRLHRPQREGEKEKLSVTGRESQEMAAWSGGKVVREEKREFTVELDCVATALAVSAKGKATRQSFLIEKLLKKEAGVPRELLPRQTVVVAFNAGQKTVFEVNGKAVEPETAQALGAVISIGSSDSTDDELFGTKERKRVGDSWNINANAMAQLLNDPRMTIKDVAGRVTLKEVIQAPSGPLLLLTFDVTGKLVPPAAPGVSAQEGTLVMKGSGEFPVDATLPRAKESTEMTVSTRATRKPNPNAAEVEMRVVMKRSMTATKTPIK